MSKFHLIWNAIKIHNNIKRQHMPRPIESKSLKMAARTNRAMRNDRKSSQNKVIIEVKIVDIYLLLKGQSLKWNLLRHFERSKENSTYFVVYVVFGTNSFLFSLCANAKPKKLCVEQKKRQADKNSLRIRWKWFSRCCSLFDSFRSALCAWNRRVDIKRNVPHQRHKLNSFKCAHTERNILP